MTPATLAGLAARYDVFLVDQFGTLHDGVRPYPGALAGLRMLHAAGRVMLLSNSGRRNPPNAARLAGMGVAGHDYDHLLSSGELAGRMLTDGRLKLDGVRRCLLLSRESDASALAGLGLLPATAAEAELVVIAGSEGERISLDEYEALLAPAARRGVRALCINPDRTMLTPSGPAFGAGRIAELYRSLGGPVTWVGKPHPEIYREALRDLGDPDPARVLGIGDSIEHDVAGARGIGIAAALVRTGIVAGDDDAALAAECARVGAAPDWVLPGLA